MLSDKIGTPEIVLCCIVCGHSMYGVPEVVDDVVCMVFRNHKVVIDEDLNEMLQEIGEPSKVFILKIFYQNVGCLYQL